MVVVAVVVVVVKYQFANVSIDIAMATCIAFCSSFFLVGSMVESTADDF